MTIRVHQFECLADNYGFLVHDTTTEQTACIDTPDAEVILRELDAQGWRLDVIFNTHWHADHAGGNEALRAATNAMVVAPQEVGRFSHLDRVVSHGDRVTLGGTSFLVLDVGGHTLGHVAYYAQAPGIVFVGDALFPMGCGRVLEGTHEQMWASLQRLTRLPASSKVYSAHEYALANAQFAVSVDPDVAVRSRAREIVAMRARFEPTVPTTIGLEVRTNPFLRAPLLPMTRGAGSDAAAFRLVRAAKDRFS